MSQGQVERDHGVLTDHLAKYVAQDGEGEDWDQYLAPAAYVHNNTTHTTTQVAPNMLLYGRIMKMPSELKTPFPEALPLNLKTQIGQLIRTIDEYQKIAEANLNLSKEKMKKEYDKKAKDTVFDPSDLVWMFTPNVPIQMLRKLRSPWIGPFRVLERTSPLNYRLRSETTNKSLKMPVHVNRLRKYFTSGLRPEDDPDLRRKCRSDPDLGLRDNDVQAHNFINSPRENGKIEKHVVNVENKNEHTVDNVPNVESTEIGRAHV
jgi:hypothetical protein